MSPRANRSWKSLMPQGFAVLSAAIVISAAFATALHVQARVDDEPETTTASPYTEPQYATLTATTNTINAAMVPIVLSNGTVAYYNLTIPLKVTETVAGAKTTVTVTAGTVAQAVSATPLISSFKAGNYVGPSTIDSGKALVTVSNPGVAPGGATEWSLTASTGAEPNTSPTSASWYVGPVSSNPNYATLKTLGLTSPSVFYGTTGTAGGYNNLCWLSNSIISVVETGSNLTITSYTSDGTNQRTPCDSITYTLITAK